MYEIAILCRIKIFVNIKYFREVDMNFSEFTKQKIHSEDPKQKNLNKDDALKTYEELKDLNSDQLTKRLFSEVKKQKSEGTFNYDMLSASVESIRPYMSNETYLNLKKLLESLK